MVVAIGNDHRGLKLKNEIINHFKNITFINVGTNDELPADHPIYAFKVGEMVTSKQAQFGILICGTGIGMSIAANKIKGIRCARVFNEDDAFTAKNHNGANVIAMGSSLSLNEIKQIVDTFIVTKSPSEERHLRRIEKVNNLEREA